MQLLKSKATGATASKPPSKPTTNNTTADNGPAPTNTGKATHGLPAAATAGANAPKDETATARATAAALARAKEVMRAGGTQAEAAAAAKEVARRVLREEQAKASASGAAGNTGGAAGGNNNTNGAGGSSGGTQSAPPATGGTEAHGGKPPLGPRTFRAGLLGKFRKKKRSNKKSTKKRKPKRGGRPTIDPIDEESSLTEENIGGKGAGSEEGRDDAEESNGRSASPVGKEGRAADDVRDVPSSAAKKRELRSNLEKSSVFASKSKAKATATEAPKSKANDAPAKASVRATESILSDDYSYSTANSADTDSAYSYGDSRLNTSSRNYSREYDRNPSMFTHRPSYGRNNMPSIYIEADARSTEDVSVLASKESAPRDPNIMDVLTFNGVMAAVDDAVDAALFPVDPHPSLTDGAGRRGANSARRNQGDTVHGALGGRSVGGDTRQSRGGFLRWLCVDVPGYGEACGEAYGDGDTKYSSNEETDGSLSLNDYYATRREKQGQGVRNAAMAAAGSGAAVGVGADGLEPNKTVSWADSLDGPQPPSNNNNAPTANHARSHSNNSSVLHAVARGAAAGRDPAVVPNSSLRNARWSGSPGEANRERAGTVESSAMASQATKGTKDTKGSDGAASAPTEAASVGSRLSALFKWGGGGSKAGEKAGEAAGVEIAASQSEPPSKPTAAPSAAGNPGGIAANNDDKPNWRAYVADTVPTMPSATSPRSTVSHPSAVAAAGGGYRSPTAHPQQTGPPQPQYTYQGPPTVGSAVVPGKGGSYVAPSVSGPATSGMAVAPGYTQSMSTLAMGHQPQPPSHPQQQPYLAPMTASPMTAGPQRWTPRVPKINSNLSVESEDDRTDRYAGMEQEVREAEEERAYGAPAMMPQGQAVGEYGYSEAASPALRMLMTEDTDGPPAERYGPPPPQVPTVVQQQPPAPTQQPVQQVQLNPMQPVQQEQPQPEPQPQQVQQHRSQASMASNDCSTQLAEANRKLGLFQQSTETEPAAQGSHPPPAYHQHRVDPNPSSVRFFAEQPPPATVSGLAVDVGAPPVQTPQDPPAMASPTSPEHADGYAAAAASPTTPTHEGYTTFAA
ncbi:hypothetical protein ACHAXT_009023 [Thalassiosira profunda]